MTSRREFIGKSALTAAGLAVSPRGSSAVPPRSLIDIRRSPDVIVVQTANTDQRLSSTSHERWEGGGVVVSTTDVPGALRVQLDAPSVAVKRIHLRWTGRLDDVRLLLGDAWE